MTAADKNSKGSLPAAEDKAKESSPAAEAKARPGALWPELVAVGLLAFFVFLVLGGAGACRLQKPTEGVRLPISADRFEGGTDFLSQDQLVALKVIVPNASKTPEVQVSTYGRVIEIRGNEAPVVLLEVAPHDADDFQLALQAEGAMISYRLEAATPTATMTPTAAPVLTPTLTDSGFGKRGYLEIEVAEIKPMVNTLPTAEASVTEESAWLVIVEKREQVVAGTPEAVTTTYSAQNYCVRVVGFLDQHHNRQPAYDPKETVCVLVSFDMANMDAIAVSLAYADQIWLENRPGCK
jgi:hypothetical protein